MTRALRRCTSVDHIDGRLVIAAHNNKKERSFIQCQPLQLTTTHPSTACRHGHHPSSDISQCRFYFAHLSSPPMCHHISLLHIAMAIAAEAAGSGAQTVIAKDVHRMTIIVTNGWAKKEKEKKLDQMGDKQIAMLHGQIDHFSCKSLHACLQHRGDRLADLTRSVFLLPTPLFRMCRSCVTLCHSHAGHA